MVPAAGRVKISTQHPQWPLSRQTPHGTGRWAGLTFSVDAGMDRADWWVVCEGLVADETAVCPPGNVVLVTWEPPQRPPYPQSFLDQFAAVITCHPKLRHPRVFRRQQGLPWFVDRSYDDLHAITVVKERDVSVVTSDKAYFKGHRDRLRFVTRLKEALGDRLDLFGRGIHEIDDKWEALAPYRYSIAIENHRADDYLTEKLTDCFLAETYPFYFGAPNAASYFPEGSFTPIDVTDPGSALKSILQTLADPSHYERHREHVVKAKKLSLDEHNLFPMLAAFISQEMPSTLEAEARELRLHPESAFAQGVVSTLRRKAVNLKSKLRA